MIYGFKEEIVTAAVMHKLLSSDKELKGMPVFGEFVKKDGRLFFKLELMEEETLDVEMSNVNVDLEVLNSDKCRLFMIRGNKKGKDYFELILSVGETKEEAEKNLDKQVTQYYLKEKKLTSKKKIKLLIDEFMEEMSEILHR
jgi:hypothetical protein